MARSLILFALLLYCSPVFPEVTPRCYFIRWWIAKAEYIRDIAELPESKWHILEGGYPPEIYDEIINIKREVYNDSKALKRRLSAACGDQI